MEKPVLKSTQFSVLHAKLSTGHLLKTDKTMYLTSDVNAKVYLIFESKRNALSYMENAINVDKEIECTLWDYEYKHLITLDKDGERKYSEKS